MTNKNMMNISAPKEAASDKSWLLTAAWEPDDKLPSAVELRL